MWSANFLTSHFCPINEVGWGSAGRVMALLLFSILVPPRFLYWVDLSNVHKFRPAKVLQNGCPYASEATIMLLMSPTVNDSNL